MSGHFEAEGAECRHGKGVGTELHRRWLLRPSFPQAVLRGSGRLPEDRVAAVGGPLPAVEAGEGARRFSSLRGSSLSGEATAGARPHEVKSPSEPRCGGFIEARGTSAQTCAGGRGWSGRSGAPSFPATEKQVAVCAGHFVGARPGPRHCRRRRDPSAPAWSSAARKTRAAVRGVTGSVPEQRSCRRGAVELFWAVM